MRLSSTSIGDILVIEIAGVVDLHAAGPLYDALVEGVRRGWTKVIVDLSGLRSLTRASVRGLIVAAKLLTKARGELRICGAGPSVEALLRGLGFSHLVKCDTTLEASIAALSPGSVPSRFFGSRRFGVPGAAPTPVGVGRVAAPVRNALAKKAS